MSDSGKQSPLGLNITGSYLQDTGLCINPTTEGLVGVSHTVTAYTPGSLITDTCLNVLTQSINYGYNNIPGVISLSTYGELISIGANSIPAFGNSKPPTYQWIGPANTGNSADELEHDKSWYPYTETDTTNTYPTTNPTPRQWSSLTSTDYTYDITQWGWVRLFALQAWNEFNWNNDPAASSVSYKDFLASFTTASGFIDYTNASINALQEGSTFLTGTFSNMNDLITGDIAGVNLATNAFGQDLIASGKAIDLTTIATFGMPSNLLLTLKRYNALTASLSLALLASGIPTNTLNDILSGAAKPTLEVEQKMYAAFLIIVSIDLQDILTPLNVTTSGLESLADLLNPYKLFPNSYISLTVPVYNASSGPTNAKTYYPIYSSTGVNPALNSPAITSKLGSAGIVAGPPSTSTMTTGSNIQVVATGFGAYTRNILPLDISIAAGAFSISMRQIRNIENVPIEKFAQLVANLETVKSLPLTAGTSLPTDTSLTDIGVQQVAYGSGPYGTYTMSDFFGCMSGLPYAWDTIKELILQLQTSALVDIYDQIYAALISGDPGAETTILGLITQANSEIADIQSRNPTQSQLLNKLWDLTGTQLTNEQRARDIAFTPVPVPRDGRMIPYPSTTYSFVDSITTYSKNTKPHMYAQTLEAISDRNTPGGQSTIARMREVRNEKRLLAAGITLGNNIPDDTNIRTTKILMANGVVSVAAEGQGIPALPATFTIPSNPCVLEDVTPQGYYNPVTNQYIVTPQTSPGNYIGTLPQHAEIGQDLAGPYINVVPNPITPVTGCKIPTGPGEPLTTGQANVPGSLAGSPYQNLVEPQLSIPYMSGILSSPVYSVAEAIDEIIKCNCDCWVN